MSGEQQHISLLKNWSVARPEYTDGESVEFCFDGPSNWDLWESQKLKILFLLKEPHSGYHPKISQDSISGNLHLNIARWKTVLRNAFENRCVLNLPDNSSRHIWGGQNNDDIAIVDIKKKIEDFKTSTYKDIMNYAEKDSAFLREQIEIINPHVILCGYTGDCLDKIYPDATWIKLNSISKEKKKVDAYSHQNRLVLDFYHPAPRTGSESLFYLLQELIQYGEIFNQYSWGQLQPTFSTPN